MVYGLQEIAALLPNHAVYFHPQHLDNYGLMMLVKKDWEVVASGDVFVYKHKGYIPPGEVGEHARSVQYVSVKNKATEALTVMNFHGLWTTKPEGKGKQDIPERIEQSQKIVEFISTLTTPFVLCGDFNLLPTTQSIKLLEEAGLRNLIKEYGITSTRTKYYPKSEKFADYAFVSNGVEVKDFKVLPDVVSDHSPLYLEIGVRAAHDASVVTKHPVS